MGDVKKVNKLAQDFNALAWFQAILGIFHIVLMLKFSEFQLLFILKGTMNFLIAFLMFRAKKYALNNSKSAFNYGVVVGILLIINADVIDLVLGILVLIDSYKYKKDVVK